MSQIDQLKAGVTAAEQNINTASGGNFNAGGAIANQLISTAGHKGLRIVQSAVMAAGVGAAEANAVLSKRDTIANFVPFTTGDEADLSTLSYLGETFGTPIYGSITIGARDNGQNPITWVDNSGKTQTMPELTVASAIINCTSAKSIVKTNIQGRDGSIKEYIGMDDVDITIDCVVNFGINQARLDIMRQLNLLYSAPVAVPITNYYLNTLGVDFIVIENIQWNQKPGEYSTLYFTINACSDMPVPNVLP